MANISGINAYQQMSQTWQAKRVKDEETSAKASATAKERGTSKVETKAYTPIESGSSLIPKKTEYGMTIGEVKLSDTAKDYYEKLKSKYHNMEFIAVSKDMKAQVQQNAAAYGNAGKIVVLIDEEKLERMATDEDYRKKYEGIIAMSESKLNDFKNSLASSGVSLKSFGMSVDDNGKTSFFATVEKLGDSQKKRIERRAEQKKEQKINDRKKAEKKAREERLEKLREKNVEKVKDEEVNEQADDKEYVTFWSHSLEKLLDQVQNYSYQKASEHVMTDTEKMLGGNVDFSG